jgi:hypothetical protein
MKMPPRDSPSQGGLFGPPFAPVMIRRGGWSMFKEGLTADEFRAALKMLPGNALVSLTPH